MNVEVPELKGLAVGELPQRSLNTRQAEDHAEQGGRYLEQRDGEIGHGPPMVQPSSIRSATIYVNMEIACRAR